MATSAKPVYITDSYDTSQVTTSSGSTNSSYGYDASGHLSTITSTAQNEALTWNDAGQLAQTAITPSGGSAKNTSYVYDADGTLLLAADPGTTTLYLPDEELSLNTDTGTVTGTRYYSLGGATVAARTGASGLAYLAGDTQGTDSVAIDSATLSANRRYYDPYGSARGTAPSSFPVGQKGFVGGAADTATNLTNLGAREYQPGTGSFISPDPLLKPYDPQNLNAYAYAADNPSTYSDPSGAMLCDPDGKCGSVQALNNYAKAQTGDTTPKPKGYIDANPRPKGYSPAPSHPRIGDRKVCEIGRGCAPLRVFLNRPDETDNPVSAPVLRTPPARPVTNGRDTNNCPMRVMEAQIGFMLEGCAGEGVTTGINLSEPSDEGEQPGADTGETDQGGGLTPGEGTRGLEDASDGTETGPEQTLHGADRAADPSRLSPAEQAEVIANPTETFTQADGAQVYVQQVGDRYNVVVEGKRGVISNFKTIRQGSLNRLARNYDWTPS
jgi:RHS repeat-associated protein